MNSQQIVVTRHAKSDWVGEVSDFDRPLSQRGVQDAKRMGHWLSKQAMPPTTIVSSPARRATQTTQILAGRLSSCPIVWVDALYLAELDDILEVVAQQRAACWALVGHNPGLETFIRYCDAQGATGIEFEKLMPTAAMTALDFSLANNRIDLQNGAIRWHQRPRQLQQ